MAESDRLRPRFASGSGGEYDLRDHQGDDLAGGKRQDGVAHHLALTLQHEVADQRAGHQRGRERSDHGVTQSPRACVLFETRNGDKGFGRVGSQQAQAKKQRQSR